MTTSRRRHRFDGLFGSDQRGPAERAGLRGHLASIGDRIDRERRDACSQGEREPVQPGRDDRVEPGQQRRELVGSTAMPPIGGVEPGVQRDAGTVEPSHPACHRAVDDVMLAAGVVFALAGREHHADHRNHVGRGCSGKSAPSVNRRRAGTAGGIR
jgi:hypothetical protein